MESSRRINVDRSRMPVSGLTNKLIMSEVPRQTYPRDFWRTRGSREPRVKSTGEKTQRYFASYCLFLFFLHNYIFLRLTGRFLLGTNMFKVLIIMWVWVKFGRLIMLSVLKGIKMSAYIFLCENDMIWKLRLELKIKPKGNSSDSELFSSFFLYDQHNMHSVIE